MDPRLGRLTARQSAVLELIAKGLTNDDISSVLGIGGETVKSHVSAILKVLEVDNRTEAAGLLNAAEAARSADFEARPAIAVLAFDVDGWPQDEGRTFGRGLVDDLIALFCQWRWFPVIARSSSLALEPGAKGTSRALGEALGARYLLRGAVRRAGERLRISAFLEDAEREVSLWAERFEVGVGELFTAQDELVRQIVGSVYPSLISAEVWRARRSRAKSLSSWTLTHRGLWHIECRSPQDNLQAHALLDQALADDPVFLPALHAKGLACFYDGVNLWTGDIEGACRQLERVAEAAVQRFPEAPHGHMLRARAAMGRGDLPGAIEHAETATAINPSLASGHALLGQMLATLGRHDEGLTRMRRAHRLSPRAYVAGIAVALFAAGRYQEALDAVEPVLVERPNYLFARLVAAACRVHLADLERAREHVAVIRREHPAFRTSEMRQLYEGRLEMGDRLFAALHRVGVPA
jgi:TolB-like protein